VTDPAIEVSGLTKVYNPGKPNEVRALDGASFQVARGTITGLLGPNGAGKTTSMEIIEGMRTATSGDVVVLGRKADRIDREWYQQIGIQFQHSAYFERLKIRELAQLFASFYSDSDDPGALLEAVNLTDRANSFVRQLSGGEAQRFSIAMAIVNKPELLVLDEPTAGLDPVARRDVWSVIRTVSEAGATVFLSTHDMAEAETMCDDVIMLRSGRVIASGSPVELIRRHGSPLTVRFQCRVGDWSPPGNFDATESPAHQRDQVLWTVRVRQESADVVELMAGIARVASSASGLERSRSSLDDVFVAVAR
jgi:ABC-2 type transport system ATP-binding protein